jgi:ectoine hydroxylase-related dioxygenase (phytanoyl-CoA dioxygenase family)
MSIQITDDIDRAVECFHRDGAVCMRGIFSDWVDLIAAGIERNMRHPGPLAANSVLPGQDGSFFDDYCNWQRIPEFSRMVHESPAAEMAARIMRSDTAQFFHDHVLVKEPGTQKPTPWHSDLPYYFLDGRQTVSFLDSSDFYAGTSEYRSVPDPDSEPDHRVLEWDMQPGDAIAFDYRTVHGARGNTEPTRRRVLSLRWVGDDMRYAERPGRTSPPYPGHSMQPGQRLREDWFPVVWPANYRPA